MNIETETVVCDGKNHKIIHYHLDSNDPLFADSLKRGAELAGKVNIHDPAGLSRDLRTRVAKCTGGMLAQKIFEDFFNKELSARAASEHRLSGIEFFEPPSDYSKGQIDFTIRSKRDNKTLLNGETRSSFSYRTGSIYNVVHHAMSLLGPYVTSTKPSEATKGIHVTVIHRVDPQDFIAQSSASSIDSFIVGGGTRDMFLNANITERDSLDQRGAVYLIIKPMWKGLDAIEVVNSIISAVSSQFSS